MPRITEDEANSSNNEVNNIKESIIAAYFTDWSVYNEKEPTAFPGFISSETDPNKNLRDGNTYLLDEKLDNVNTIVYSFLEIKQDKNTINPLSGRLDSSYTTKQDDLGKVVFFDPWSDFAKENVVWPGTNNYKWQKANIDLLPQKMGTIENPLTLDPSDTDNFNYSFFHYGNFNALANSDKVANKVIGIGGYGDHYTHGWKAAVAHPDRFSDSFPITVDQKQIENFETNYGKTHGKWAELAKYVDHIGIMGYDMHGAFDYPKLTGLHSMLYPVKHDKSGYSVDGAIQKLNEFGIANDQITLGVPGYARGVEGVIKAGLNQKFTTADSQANLDSNAGITSYTNLINDVFDKYLVGDNPEGMYTKKLEDVIMDVTVKVDGKDVVTGAYANIDDKFYSFESPDSLQAKVDYVKDHGLAGMFIWTIENDHAGEHSLLHIMHDGLIG